MIEGAVVEPVAEDWPPKQEVMLYWVVANTLLAALLPFLHLVTQKQGFILETADSIVVIAAPGIAQWLVLKRYLPGIRAWEWVWRTFIGGLLGAVLGLSLVLIVQFTLFGIHDLFWKSPLGLFLFGFPTILFGSLFAASAQWKVLGRYFVGDSRWSWVLASILAGILSLLIFSANTILSWNSTLDKAATATVGALFGSLLTGWVLIRLMEAHGRQVASPSGTARVSGRGSQVVVSVSGSQARKSTKKRK